MTRARIRRVDPMLPVDEDALTRVEGHDRDGHP